MALVGAACLGLLATGIAVTPLHAYAGDDSTALVAHWKFDEATAGSHAVDSVGSNDGTPVGGNPVPSTDVPEVPFHNPFSAEFNGNDYFVVKNPVSQDFTICARVKTSVMGGAVHWESAPILEAEAGGADFDFGFGIDNTGKLMFGNGGMIGDSLTDGQVNGATTVSDGKWHHVCATRSDSDAGAVVLYVDGRMDATGFTGLGALTSNQHARIGAGSDGAKPFVGLIDDLRVYGSALSAAQVATVAAGGDPSGVPTETAGPTATATATATATVTAAPTVIPTPPDPPTDDDGVAASVEAAAPNRGDANGDGVPDAEQSTVASFPDPGTGRYISLVVDDGCTLTEAAGADGSVRTGDEGFTYPVGLVQYTARCAVGAKIRVLVYFYGAPDAELTARKFDPATGRYTTIEGARLTRMTIGGAAVVQASYHVTDGGPLDSDGVVNGIIVDPVGLAQADAAQPAAATTPTAPVPHASAEPALADTGTAGMAGASWAGSIAILAGLILLLVARRRYDESERSPSAP